MVPPAAQNSMSTENTGGRKNQRRKGKGKGKSKATVNDSAPEPAEADPRGTSPPADAFYDAQNPSEDDGKKAGASSEKLESDMDFDEFQMANYVAPTASEQTCKKKSREEVVAEMEKLVTIPSKLPLLPEFSQYMDKIKGEVQTIYERYTPGSRLKTARAKSKGPSQLKHYLTELRQELSIKPPASHQQ